MFPPSPTVHAVKKARVELNERQKLSPGTNRFSKVFLLVVLCGLDVAPKFSEAATSLNEPWGSINVCQGKKPIHSDAAGTDGYFNNVECMIDGVTQALEQAGANVTKGYRGDIDATSRAPITDPYWKVGLCPVNVHWHLGAEHLSVVWAESRSFVDSYIFLYKDNRKTIIINMRLHLVVVALL